MDRRLLRSDQRADGTFYELSHDTLIEPVLATRRVKGRFLGLLTRVSERWYCCTALILLIGLLALLHILAYVFGLPLSKNLQEEHEPNFFLGLATSLLVFLPGFAFLGIFLCRRGSKHSADIAHMVEEKGRRFFTSERKDCIFELGALIDEVPIQDGALLMDQKIDGLSKQFAPNLSR